MVPDKFAGIPVHAVMRIERENHENHERHETMNNDVYSRRQFLGTSAGLAISSAAGLTGWHATGQLAGGGATMETPAVPRGKAESCIFIWLGGGACHIDMWDPKRRGDGRKKPGSYYDPIATAIPGVQVTEHLKRTAPLLDRAVLIRTVNHEISDHAAAVNRLHTGRATSGTIVYPSIGSVVVHERGPIREGVPAYVVMGYPNITRGPGFLGSKCGYIYLTETKSGPTSLMRPPDITSTRQKRRERLLARVRERYLRARPNEQLVEDYAEVQAEGFRLAGPEFMDVFQLSREPAELRESYGGEFGQRCLLARRLVQSGVRFMEVAFNLNFINGTGWDTHNEGQLKQHGLIDELDRALSTLILDLERRKLLDSTLIVIASEFGRPPEFDSGGGRGHHPHAFSVFLAGGSLRTGQVVGETDELGRKIVSGPVSVPDLHATIYCALAVDPAKELFSGERPVPITDLGKPLAELFG